MLFANFLSALASALPHQINISVDWFGHYLEEQFSVEIFLSTTQYGWRLAAVSDIRDSSGYVKDAVKAAMGSWEWGIACLANDARVNISALKKKII